MIITNGIFWPPSADADGRKEVRPEARDLSAFDVFAVASDLPSTPWIGREREIERETASPTRSLFLSFVHQSPIRLFHSLRLLFCLVARPGPPNRLFLVYCENWTGPSWAAPAQGQKGRSMKFRIEYTVLYSILNFRPALLPLCRCRRRRTCRTLAIH